MTEPKAESYGDDTHTRIAAVQTRISRLSTVETKLKKLNIALSSLSLSARPRQLSLIKQARAYVEVIKAEPVQGISASLRILDNELISMNEGIRARTVAPEDLNVMSGITAQTVVKELISNAHARLTRLQSELTANGAYDPSEQEINKSRAELEQIPQFGDKEFIVHRVPVVFSGANSGDTKFSKVGYVNVDALDRAGFKAGIIGGYTVVKKQMAIGINPNYLFKTVIDKETQAEKRVPITVKTTKQISKGGKPVSVDGKRPKTALDAAKKVVKLLKEKTGVDYEFLTTTPTSYQRGSWFWVMPVSDLRRFARAFPGGRVDIRSWGFAGEQK